MLSSLSSSWNHQSGHVSSTSENTDNQRYFEQTENTLLKIKGHGYSILYNMGFFFLFLVVIYLSIWVVLFWFMGSSDIIAKQMKWLYAEFFVVFAWVSTGWVNYMVITFYNLRTMKERIKNIHRNKHRHPKQMQQMKKLKKQSYHDCIKKLKTRLPPLLITMCVVYIVGCGLTLTRIVFLFIGLSNCDKDTACRQLESVIIILIVIGITEVCFYIMYIGQEIAIYYYIKKLDIDTLYIILDHAIEEKLAIY